MENASDCTNSTSLLDNKINVGFVISTISLGLIIILVISGNILVIAAVLTTRKLRTVTNIFIVNLACADLLLGIFVLPFSAALEVLDSWIFGQIWCHVWLATDVLLCTASIFNLCCISFDRYVAITRPMKYPGIMSSKRGKLLVAATWVVSFLICFPPLIGWNDGKAISSEDSQFGSNGNITIGQMIFKEFYSNSTQHLIVNSYMLETNYSEAPTQIEDSASCEVLPVTCELINTRGYRVYSALGSYFIPMFIMVFFYIRIYRAAVKTISAYQKGVLTTKTNGEMVNNKVTLRVHRGGSYINHSGKPGRPASTGSTNRNSIERKKSSEKSSKKPDAKRFEMVTPLIQTSYPKRYRSRYHTYKSNECPTCETTITVTHDTQSDELDQDRQLSNNGLTIPRDKSKKSHNSNDKLKPSNGIRIKFSEKGPTRTASALQKTGKHMKAQMRKFNREQKAAKTLAIIVGAFILCWLPFFSIYLIGAFCDNCIPTVLFSILFWLGYCNSAINPCVYALFAKDFRFAFKKLLTFGIRRRPPKSTSDLNAMNLNPLHSLNNFSDNSSES